MRWGGVSIIQNVHREVWVARQAPLSTLKKFESGQVFKDKLRLPVKDYLSALIAVHIAVWLTQICLYGFYFNRVMDKDYTKGRVHLVYN